MNLDVDYLINFFKKFGGEKPSELDEQGKTAGGSGETTAGGKSMPKWEELYGLKKGKANPKTAGGQKWETGLTRGVANQIW